MQADDDVAKKLAALTMKAKLERAELQSEILEIRSKPRSISSMGLTAIKTARAMGINDLKLVLPIAKSVVLPAGLALGRILWAKSSPKRVAGVAAVLGAAFGIMKGIQYDNRRHIEDSQLPVVIDESDPEQKK